MNELLTELQNKFSQAEAERDRYSKLYAHSFKELVDKSREVTALKKQLEEANAKLAEAEKIEEGFKLLAEYAALVNTILGDDTASLLFTSAERMYKARKERSQK